MRQTIVQACHLETFFKLFCKHLLCRNSTSSNKAISRFAAKYRQIIGHRQVFIIFLHIYYIQNDFYLETVYTSASKLLPLFASKHPTKTVAENGLLFIDQEKMFLIKRCTTYL